MNTLLLLATLMIGPHLEFRAQIDNVVLGWCVDERGRHEFESNTEDYYKAGFAACEQ